VIGSLLQTVQHLFPLFDCECPEENPQPISAASLTVPVGAMRD
jgi:hypothetical protein